MTQSRKNSLLESVVGTIIGMLVVLLVSPMIYKLCDVPINNQQIWWVTVLLTIISILRGYIVRRLFNKLGKNKHMDRYRDRLYQEWSQHDKIVIGLDFDDTIYPWKFKDKEGLRILDETIQILKIAKQTGAYIVVFTACAPDRHNEIKEYCKSIGLEIDSINNNPIDLPYGHHGKIFANIFIDDRAGINESLDILQDAMYRIRSDRNVKNIETWLE